MAYDPSIFNISPYYDDYDPANRFLRILFKPGYAVQARELTQMQSILQDQISKIGDHLFKDGSRIVGAPISVRNTNFLGLRTGSGSPFNAFGSTDWASLVGGTIYWGATASGTIAHVLPPETDDKLFVVVDYVSGYGAQIPTTGVTLGITTSNGGSYSPMVAAGTSHNGLCKLVTVGEGIFYVDGAFVLNTEQSFTPYTISGTYRDLTGTSSGVTFAGLDKKVGFAVTRDTTTSAEDLTLLDPSFGSPNYKAPGGDRFVINLDLTQVDLTDTPNDFVEILRFEDGKVTKKADKVVYGDIAKTLAQRTYDESGSYVVSPFDVSVRNSSTDATKLDVVVGPGKAYVFGNEVETKYPTIIGITKARTTQSAGGSFGFNTGNVLGVSLDTANYGATAYTYFNNMNGGYALVRFRNSSGAFIGQAGVHGLVPRAVGSGKTSAAYSMYLYGICTDSVISGASSAVVYGSPGGASAGITFGIFGPITGTTFGIIGGSGANDTSLVYEITPTQGVSAFTALSFYGKVVSKTLGVSFTSPTNTWTVTPSDLDLPTGSYNTSFIDVAPDLSGTSTSVRSTISKYQFINSGGIVFSPANNDAGDPLATVSVYKSGSNLVMGVSGGPTGFTAASPSVRMVLPFKYTANFASASGFSGTCRIKVSTARTVTATAFNFANINGRVGFTLPNWDVYSVTGLSFDGADKLADFELDDGQREGFYDYSALVCKKSKEGTYTLPLNKTVTCSYNYFQHGGTTFGPFVGQHSYLGISYDQIPLFTNPKTGRTVSLANCVDFRHSGPTLDNIYAKPYGDYESLSATTVSWSNYLPRIDRLSLKINPSDLSTSFAVDSGVAELSPQSPPETENSMTVATLTVPAYTYRPQEVVVIKNDVRRYTMTDIHNVERRVDEIETFAKLSLSESEMAGRDVKPIVDGYIANGGSTASLGVSSLNGEPIKTSIYTDDFYGHAGGDVSDKDHRCAVDYQYGELRPMFTHNLFSLGGITSSSGTTVSSDGLVTLDYTSTPLITNDGYNKSVAVNPTGTVNWLGFMKFTKQYETGFDTGVRPVVYNNNMSENDNWVGSNANNARGFGTQWNDWEYLWTGTQIRTDGKDDVQKRILETPRTNSPSSIPTTNSGNEKTAINRNTTPTDQKVGNLLNSSRLIGRTKYKTLDNRMVDRTVVPYVPVNNNIGVTAYGLRPSSTGLNLYVDGVLVKSGLSANSNGTVGVTFSFTSEGYLSGEKSVRISDNATTQNATQAADGIFYCGGNVRQRFDGVYSTRNPEYRRQAVTSEGIIKDPFQRDVSYDNIQETINSNQWIDPLCQTFIIDAKAYPEGVYANSVTLYFDTKDTTLPVTVQLRPTINGYPSPSVSFPMSTVTLMPSQVNTGYVGGTVEPLGTGFTFSSPIYLEPGEYAIAVMTNSKNYTLRAYDSGVDLTNTGRGGNNPAVGTLYQPQSVGAAAQNLSTDIAFTVNRCEFGDYSSGTVDYANQNITNCQVIKVNVPQITPLNCTSAIILDTSSPLVLQNNQNKYLSSVYTSTKDLRFSLTRPSIPFKSYLSPAVDTGVFFGVGAAMIATTDTTASPSSAYVSKAVTLPEDLVSNGIFATAEVCCPYGSQVRAYVRYTNRGESDLFGQSWVAMTAVEGIGSPKIPFTAASNLSKSEYDFRPTRWALFDNTTGIRGYQIKLVFTIDSTVITDQTKTYSVLPAIRNLRMASLRTV
jgi:hypothetical protein